MKKKLSLLVSILLVLALFAGCANSASATQTNSSGDGIQIVATIFAPYDFARQITAGTNANVTMLLQPGEEVHSFDPTTQDILRIQNSDLFLYVGGENDTWVDNVLSGLDKSVRTLKLMDCVTLYEEETVEGMQAEEEEPESDASGAPEWDEHVWTAPQNAIAIVASMTDELCRIDPANADAYRANAGAYTEQLTALDNSFRDVVDHAARRTVVFADRFPARYFVEEFGLTYYAAFPGCSADTEPSAATVSALIDRVKAENIPVVFYIELSDQRMADAVCEATGAKKLLFDCCHNVTKAEFESGATYLSLMQANVETLRKALN